MKLNGVEQMSKHKPYYGAARFVEIAPPGIAYRGFANVDHITNISFGEERKDVPVIPEGEAPPESPLMESQVVGFSVTLSIGGQESKFTFVDLDIAMEFYNSTVTRIQRLVPCDTLPALRPAREPTIEESALHAAMDELDPMTDEEALDRGEPNAHDLGLDRGEPEDDGTKH